MARGSTQATDAATSAQKLSSSESGNAAGIYGTLEPILAAQAAHPTGMTAEDKANANTSAQQSVGGGESAAVGQGALRSARTRNAGGADAAIADAARQSGRNLSDAALKTELTDAQMKAQNQRAAEAGLGNLFSENLSGGNQALGQVAGDVNANSEALKASWTGFNSIYGPLVEAAGKAAGGYAAGGCWIAEAVYGVDDWRTHTVRAWLNGPFRETFMGSLVMDTYLAIGKQVAWAVRHSSLLRRAFKPLFDKALRKALA